MLTEAHPPEANPGSEIAERKIQRLLEIQTNINLLREALGDPRTILSQEQINALPPEQVERIYTPVDFELADQKLHAITNPDGRATYHKDYTIFDFLLNNLSAAHSIVSEIARKQILGIYEDMIARTEGLPTPIASRLSEVATAYQMTKKAGIEWPLYKVLIVGFLDIYRLQPEAQRANSQIIRTMLALKPDFYEPANFINLDWIDNMSAQIDIAINLLRKQQTEIQ